MSTKTNIDTSTGSILEKLKVALRSDGDFPVRAKVVMDLRNLVNDPNSTIEKITECILREPSLGTRVLHLVNSSFYRRNSQVMTVSQAVVQLGMKSLGDLCAGLVLMQRFIPAAKTGGFFADSIKKLVLSSALTSLLLSEHSDGDRGAEKGYLSATLYGLGPLLLAYYFPQVFEAAEKRAQARGQRISQSLTEIIGISPAALSVAVVDALGIPPFYRNVMLEAYALGSSGAKSETASSLVKGLAFGERIADAAVYAKNRADFESSLRAIAEQAGYSSQEMREVVVQLPVIFKQHCKITEMTFLSLPDFVENYAAEPQQEAEAGASRQATEQQDTVSFYIDEIKTAIGNGESLSSIITSVMETLAFGLGFDRVLLLFSDTFRSVLEGKMALGQDFGVDPKSIRRKIDPALIGEAPDISAFVEGCLQLYGEPVFQDGWPFAAIPIGIGDRALGVVYADKLAPADGEAVPLDSGAQVAVNMLGELLDQAITINS
jgi:hypothetical protein